MKARLAVMLKQLAVLYLFFSFVLLTSSVPSSRSFMSSVEVGDDSVLQLVAQEELATGEKEEGDALIIEGRMDIERNDYPDPGPNRGHDPKVPGTA